MTYTGQNAYEYAFEGRLREQGVRFARVDQARRCVLCDAKAAVKTFDYLLYPRQGAPILVELKGRRFSGLSLAGRKGLQRWVFDDDVISLEQWQQAFNIDRPGVRAAFVFAYQMIHIAADTDGLEIYSDGQRRYVFLAIWCRDYRHWMTRRSRRWKTVTCPAEAFRTHSFAAEQLWYGVDRDDEQNSAIAGRDGAGSNAADRRTGCGIVESV